MDKKFILDDVRSDSAKDGTDINAKIINEILMDYVMCQNIINSKHSLICRRENKNLLTTIVHFAI